MSEKSTKELKFDRFKPKTTYKGVQFDGKNSPEVAEWIRAHGGAAKAGGSYVNILVEPDTLDWMRARKGDWILDYGQGFFAIYPDAVIEEKFQRLAGGKK